MVYYSDGMCHMFQLSFLWMNLNQNGNIDVFSETGTICFNKCMNQSDIYHIFMNWNYIFIISHPGILFRLAPVLLKLWSKDKVNALRKMTLQIWIKRFLHFVMKLFISNRTIQCFIIFELPEILTSVSNKITFYSRNVTIFTRAIEFIYIYPFVLISNEAIISSTIL